MSTTTAAPSTRFLLLAAFLLFAGVLSTAQEVFAPFPSRIRVATRDPEVRISWDDASDLRAKYLVYRHTEEITIDSLALAELVGVVDPGVESFIDTPPETGSYYYAVLAQDTDDTIYEVLVPFRNTIVSPVEVESGAGETVRTVRVRNLSTRLSENTIVVGFTTGRNDRTLALYRSVRPIRTTEDLAGATRIATMSSSRNEFTDHPVPGVGYHYAVVDTELIAEGRIELVPGENTTAGPVEIALPERSRPAVELPRFADAPASRARPLPFFQIQGAVERGSSVFGAGGPTIPPRRELEPETDKAVVQLIRLAAPTEPPEPTLEVLPPDRSTPPDQDGAKGLDLTLRTIVEGPMAQGNWEEAELMLRNFRRLPLDDDLSYRASFYLGQVLYFRGEYRPAALAFLTAQEGYYPEATRWLDRALRVFPDE